MPGEVKKRVASSRERRQGEAREVRMEERVCVCACMGHEGSHSPGQGFGFYSV